MVVGYLKNSSISKSYDRNKQVAYRNTAMRYMRFPAVRPTRQSAALTSIENSEFHLQSGNAHTCIFTGGTAGFAERSLMPGGEWNSLYEHFHPVRTRCYCCFLAPRVAAPKLDNT